MRDVVAVIDTGNLKFNFLSIRNKVGPASKVMAVVKADCYGHNINYTVPALCSLQNPPDYFGVALADEGAEVRSVLRGLGSEFHYIPVLVFEPLSESNIDTITENDLCATVFAPEHLELLRKYPKNVKAHVKCDTGMGRLGINFKNAPDFINLVMLIKNVILQGIYTHFATSDAKEKSFADLQLKRFKEIVNALKTAGIDYGLAHCANSGAIFDMPDSYMDMVRPGISLYGYKPSLEVRGELPLKPVMSIRGKVASVRKAHKGESVGYGQLYFPQEGETIFSVGMGYADGYLRRMTNFGECLWNGKKCKLVGRVSMDRITFSGGNESVKTGDEVILLGMEGDWRFDGWDFAKLMGTIPYEVTCGISKRVPRVKY